MKYVLEFSFKDKPICTKCMISCVKGERLVCAGIGNRPLCPEDGCRKDCPLKKSE